MSSLNKKDKVEFIDLFAGIGGFHNAFNEYSRENKISSECIYASEIDPYAINVYNENFGIDSNNDITKCEPSDEKLSNYNLLFAGFPCQAFSKAGSRKGFKDETKGTLFFEIERLLEYRVTSGKPVKYILLENVSNLGSHDKGKTIKTIHNHLKKLGYYLTKDLVHLSPHQLGVPQLRSRVFILGVHKDYVDIQDLVDNEFLDFKHPENKRTIKNRNKMTSILENKKVAEEYYISPQQCKTIEIWNDFYQIVKANKPVIGFPIWAEIFIKSKSEIKELLNDSPKWKVDFISKNIELYNDNKVELDKWLKKNNNLKDLAPTHRKFEWQCGKHCQSIEDGIVQFRPSGIRVKRPTEFPALVAMVQIPLIFDCTNRWRKLTIEEVGRLQSFPDNQVYDPNIQQAYKQFGNSVNVDVVKYCIKELFKY